MPSRKAKFKSAPRYNLTPLKALPGADLIKEQKNFATTLPQFFHYRKPVVKRSKGKIYIEYWYRIPHELRPLFKNKEWERYRPRFDINRRKDDKEQYAEWLRSEIENNLKNGYSPFNAEPLNNFIQKETTEEKELNATDAMYLFLEAWNKRGLEKHTMEIYSKVVKRFIEWLKRKKIPYTEITNITTSHIETFLSDTKKDYGFGNREYNNHRNFLRTAFLWLKSKKHIADNPFTGIEKLRAPVTKHRFFDTKTLNDLIKILEINDPYTLFAAQTVYYLCVRSEKEMKNLKVGNIYWEQNKLLAEVTKGKNERYIPLDENIKGIFLKRGIDKFPADYYIFGINGKPSDKPFGKGFFSKRFRKICNDLKLSKDFSLYGFKHSRVVHLKSDQVPDADIMSLTGHTDFTSYTKYLRDLNLTADIKNINAKSRKI